jgi:hypothetical protein
MPPLVVWTAVLGVVVVFATALGARVLRVMRFRAATRVEHGVLAALLGLGLWPYVPWVLWALGIGRDAGVRWATVAVGLVLLPDAWRVVRSASSALRQGMAPRHGETWRRAVLWDWAMAACLAVAFALALVRAVCPPSHADALGYHLPAVQGQLDAGRFTFLPTLSYTAWPIGVQSLFAILMAFDRTAPVAIIHFLFGVLTVVGAWAVAARTSGRGAGLVAAGALIALHSFTRLLFHAYVDLAVTGLALAAAMALAQGTARRGLALPLAALFGAFAINAKLTGIWVPVGSIIAASIGEWALGMPWRERIRRIVAPMAIVCAVAVLPWLIRTWVLTGNPFHPLFSQWIPTREWSPQAMGRLREMFLLFGVPPGMAPTPRVVYTTRAVLVALTVGAAVCVTRLSRRAPARDVVRSAAFTLCGIVAGVGPYGRYFLPCAPGAAVGLASAMRRMGTAAAVIGLALGASGVRTINRNPEPALDVAWRFASGRMSREAFLRLRVPGYDLIEYCNRSLPPRSRVLVVGTFYDHVALYKLPVMRGDPWTQDAFHYDSVARLHADLVRERVTHVVVAPFRPEMVASKVYKVRYDTEVATTLRVLGERRAVFEVDGWRLFECPLPLTPAHQGQR